MGLGNTRNIGRDFRVDTDGVLWVRGGRIDEEKEALKYEVARLRIQLERTSRRSNRRKTAIKQMQSALAKAQAGVLTNHRVAELERQVRDMAFGRSTEKFGKSYAELAL